MHYDQRNACRTWCFMQQRNGLRGRGLWDFHSIMHDPVGYSPRLLFVARCVYRGAGDGDKLLITPR